ncbi:glycosyltransferase [Wohlfahrtiimonas chitiniclastica]|uniref:hypothetical protein n=1 Tax=Wohlfahrtiimonas chitiniclastica TaxID=400946 RepID=UPI001BCC0C0E|nr:hypothetical protein [Wohlfahrtiimonas chitiniclastica]MBS7820934.1 glycosyltransferase [Wohlfahrtiimonas chitiniclastica]
MMRIDCLFIDPFNNCKSGVTQYTLLCHKFLLNQGKKSYILNKNMDESLEAFCQRIASFVDQNDIQEIEAPETLACTRYVQHENIHIRLHLSRQVGRYLQGFNIDYDAVAVEQREIDRAKYLSAPSCIALEVSQKIFNIDGCYVYPNPVDMTLIYENYSKIDSNAIDVSKQKIYFIARGESLKGIVFLEIFKFFESSLICIGDKKLELFLKKNNFSIPFLSGEDREHTVLPKCNDIIIVPSLFETWSMVGVEGLTNFARVVTWEHLGFCEFFDNDCLSKVEFPNSEHFIMKIQEVTNKPFSSIDKAKVLENIESVHAQFIMGVERRVMNIEWVCNNASVLNEIKKVAIRAKKDRFRALLRKLFSHPLLFWHDSKLGQTWKKFIK